MKTTINKMIAILGMATLTFVSCTKKGDTGPAGQTGQQGAPGNANVKTYDFTIPTSKYTVSSTNVYETSTIDYAPFLSIGQYDAVMVYLYDATGWMAMPFSSYYNTSSAYNTHSFKITDWQTVWVYIRNSSGGVPYSNMATAVLKYRIVVIAGAPGMKIKPNTVNLSDYKMVKEYYNLKD